LVTPSPQAAASNAIRSAAVPPSTEEPANVAPSPTPQGLELPPPEGNAPAQTSSAAPAEANVVAQPSTSAENPPANEPPPTLLAPSATEQAAPLASLPRPSQPASGDGDDAKRRYYDRLFRPPHNPGRIGFGGQADIAFVGPNDPDQGGRMIHLELDFVHRWNRIGYGINAQSFFGDIPLSSETVQKGVPNSMTGELLPPTTVFNRTNVIVGGGARVNLGRLSMIGIGYLDPQIGYAVHYAPVHAPADSGAKIDAVAPHGPEFRLDAGFVTHAENGEKWWRSFGVGFGYQAWIASFVNKLPTTHVVFIGIRYHVH
jgi:hypothetical protein